MQKLVQGQLSACIKLAIIRPARYVHESWLSYDQLGTCKTAGPLGQLGACIKLAVIRPARYVRESWLSYDQLGTCRTAGRLDQLGACKKVGPGPTRCVHKVGSYQTSLVRARKLVILRPAWYVQNSWSSWPTRCVHKVGCYKTSSVRARKLVMTSLVCAKQLVVLTNSVRAKKLVPGQLGACIKLAFIRPAWYVHESWLSYDQLGTCKTAGPLGQLGACIKLAVIRPARYVRKSWLSYDQLGTCKIAGPLGQLGACIKLAVLKPTRCVQRVGSFLDTWAFKLTLPEPQLGRRGCASLVLEMTF